MIDVDFGLRFKWCVCLLEKKINNLNRKQINFDFIHDCCLLSIPPLPPSALSRVKSFQKQVQKNEICYKMHTKTVREKKL